VPPRSTRFTSVSYIPVIVSQVDKDAIVKFMASSLLVEDWTWKPAGFGVAWLARFSAVTLW
jgi:hypothetical protein